VAIQVQEYTTLQETAPSNFGRDVQRAVTGVEGNLYGVCVEILGGRSAVDLAFQHDQQHDRWLDAAVQAIDDRLARVALDRESAMFLRGVRRMIVEAQKADALEDGEFTAADGRMAAAQEEARAGAGAIERLLVNRTRE
jgi:hypothetical protein